MCHPHKAGTVGAEPFSAKLHYTDTEDPEHANLIKLSVTMPHTDGEQLSCWYCWRALFAKLHMILFLHMSHRNS